MNKQSKQSAPLTTQELLAGRSFSELSESERATYGKLHQASADRMVKAVVSSLNRQTAAHGH